MILFTKFHIYYASNLNCTKNSKLFQNFNQLMKFLKICNDDQSLLIWETYAAICHTIAHQLLCLKPSVVLVVSPIWAGSFRTQGQVSSHCIIISEIYNNCSDFQLANK